MELVLSVDSMVANKRITEIQGIGRILNASTTKYCQLLFFLLAFVKKCRYYIQLQL